MSIEGRRSPTGELLKYRHGCSALALSTRTPIVPMTFKGAFEAMPYGEYRIRPGRIHLVLGEVVFPEEPAEDRGAYQRQVAELTNRLRRITEAELKTPVPLEDNR